MLAGLCKNSPCPVDSSLDCSSATPSEVSKDRESSASCLYSTNLGDADRTVRESSNIEPRDSLRSDLESDTILSTQHLAVVQSEPLSGSIQRSVNSQNRFFHSLESNSLFDRGKLRDQLSIFTDDWDKMHWYQERIQLDWMWLFSKYLCLYMMFYTIYSKMLSIL